MDQLARNVDDLRRIVSTLTADGVSVSFEKESLSLSPAGPSPFDQLMLTLLGAFADFEHAITCERQREGIEQANARGVYKGRKPELSQAQIAHARQRVAGQVPRAVVARELGVSRQTLYRALELLST